MRGASSIHLSVLRGCHSKVPCLGDLNRRHSFPRGSGGGKFQKKLSSGLASSAASLLSTYRPSSRHVFTWSLCTSVSPWPLLMRHQASHRVHDDDPTLLIVSVTLSLPTQSPSEVLGGRSSAYKLRWGTPFSRRQSNKRHLCKLASWSWCRVECLPLKQLLRRQ